MIDKETFVELAGEIAEWHKQTFPDASEDGQVLKLSEEFTELFEAEKEDDEAAHWKETADIVIVSGVLFVRYKNELGRFIFDRIMDILYMSTSMPIVLNAVKTKMEINRRRKWVKLPDGRYKHVEREKE